MKKQRVPIQERLRRYFSLVTLIPMLVFAVIFSAYAVANTLQVNATVADENMRRTASDMNRLMQEAASVGKSVVDNSRLKQILTDDYSDEQEKFRAELIGNNELSYISRYFDNRIQVYIIGANGILCKNSMYSFAQSDYRQEDWYMQIFGGNEEIWLPVSVHSRVVNNISGKYCALGIPIYSLDGTGKTLGVLLVEISMDHLFDNPVDSGSYFYIISPNWNMRIVQERVEQYENDVFTVIDERGIVNLGRNDEKPNFIQESMKRITYWRSDFKSTGMCYSASFVINYAMVESNRCILVKCVPYLILYRTPIMIGVLMLCIILLSVVLALVTANYLSGTFIRPIKLLNDSAHKVSDGNFDLVIEKSRNDEIGDLTDQFNFMVKHIHELMDHIIEEQRIQRKYELLLLQAQINPHFLYNSLDSIMWLVRMRKNDDAEIMLGALTRFFKTGLNKGNDNISLEQEMENVRSYMTIQQYRYRTKMNYVCKLDPAVKDVIVPKLMLQPLVENAIYHGIKEKEGMGTIVLRCEQNGNEILITVSDDGIGMNEQTLEQLQEQLYLEEVKTRKSYGILNVYERLKLFFKDRCSMTIQSRENEGCTIIIRIVREGSADHV